MASDCEALSRDPVYYYSSIMPFTHDPVYLILAMFPCFRKHFTFAFASKSSCMASEKFVHLPVYSWGGGLIEGISRWGCAARTLEPLAYTRVSFSWILLPFTRVNSPNYSYPR